MESGGDPATTSMLVVAFTFLVSLETKTVNISPQSHFFSPNLVFPIDIGCVWHKRVSIEC